MRANRSADESRDRLREAMLEVARGDRQALQEVYSATSAKLFGICLRILGDRAEAEDALQDVYLSLWRRADRFDPDRASPITWLATFARNRAIDRLRGGKVRGMAAPIELAEAIADKGPNADEAIEARQLDTRLHRCLGALEAPQRDAIRQAFFQGQTYAELAERQDVPLGTMKSWIRRGLAKLKACLEP